MFTSLLAKIVLTSTIYFAPAAPTPHAYTATVDTAELVAGLDRATAKLEIKP